MGSKVVIVPHPREFLYPSNMLSLGRLVLIVPTVAALGKSDKQRQAFVLLGASMFTDVLDGAVARWRGEETRLGEVLDPIADKLLLDASAVMLSWRGVLPWWLTVLLLARDIGIVSGGLLLYHRTSHIIRAQPAGKAATVCLTSALLLYTADGPRSGKPVFYVALALAALSVWQYGRRFIALMKGK